MTTDVIVYLVLLGIAGLQIILAYSYHGGGEGLLGRLLIVAAIQAVVAVLFFMHLRWENRAMLVSVAVVTLFVLISLQYSWSDSFRLLHGVPFARFH
ncbi:MAG TPA: cytochrome C oxidase subunit IV family protein [Terriglobales bacterium]|nr:cytochrome C oxidase subunit IV family protein [Terriglobales bacterium]